MRPGIPSVGRNAPLVRAHAESIQAPMFLGWLGAMLLLAALWNAPSARGASTPEATASKPQRLVSLCVQGDQLLLQLVPRSRILLLSQYASDPEISTRWREAEGIPCARGGMEELVRLQPDLVVVSAYSSPTLVALLKGRGVRVLETGILNDFKELRTLIRTAGDCLGEPERAETVLREMDERIERLQAKRPPPETRKRAMFYFQDGFAPGGRSFANALLELAGFLNAAAALHPGAGASTSLEEVLMAQPDVLILTNYCEAHPTLTQGDWAHPVFRKLGSKTRILRVPFQQLASPDPENLALAERLQQCLPR